jgi:hypothetical protein
MFTDMLSLKKFASNTVHFFRRYTAAMLLALALGSVVLPGLATAGDCKATTNSELADAIAKGHAFTEHAHEFRQGVVAKGLPFGPKTIADEGEFAIFLTSILDTPTASKALTNHRHAYWGGATGTIIITNAKVDDCGTAFRPRRGLDYYDDEN